MIEKFMSGIAHSGNDIKSKINEIIDYINEKENENLQRSHNLREAPTAEAKRPEKPRF